MAEASRHDDHFDARITGADGGERRLRAVGGGIDDVKHADDIAITQTSDRVGETLVKQRDCFFFAVDRANHVDCRGHRVMLSIIDNNPALSETRGSHPKTARA